MAWSSLIWTFPLVVVIVSGCKLDNPAFDESRQTAADKGDESGSTAPEAGDGVVDTGTGDGDGDAGTGDGDGDTGTGDGDGDAGTGDGDVDTGDGDPGVRCDGLAAEFCEQTNGCALKIYTHLDYSNDMVCLGQTVFEGCVPVAECIVVEEPFWCNEQLEEFIAVPEMGCQPNVVNNLDLVICDPPGNTLEPC
ncbi:hypothetical protein [Enhygromyxa salina]|uniref:Endo-1,4-beta-xylanase A n=1 Tax=Enhygromyxa salina TaxID=215803 RepID=A0A2S9Y8A5_9BACT|nr:hypothetical protein [Enhygromyxa salina]PRQ01329.1 hypothetical protein ENSA7_56920 [Enhygromyxa salina]